MGNQAAAGQPCQAGQRTWGCLSKRCSKWPRQMHVQGPLNVCFKSLSTLPSLSRRWKNIFHHFSRKKRKIFAFQTHTHTHSRTQSEWERNLHRQKPLVITPASASVSVLAFVSTSASMSESVPVSVSVSGQPGGLAGIAVAACQQHQP